MAENREYLEEIIFDLLETSQFKSFFEEALSKQTEVLIGKILEGNQQYVREQILEKELLNYQRQIEDYKEQNKKLKAEVLLNKESLFGIESQFSVLSGKLEDVSQENKKLEKMSEDLKISKSEAEKKLEEKEVQFNVLKNDLDVVQEKLKSFELITQAYKAFMKLSSETKNRLGNIFENRDIYGFISAGMQWDNLEGLWDFIRRKVVEEETQEIAELNYIFNNLFEIYNKQTNDLSYKAINPRIGEIFDSDKHIIIGTKTDGTVQKVALIGIENLRTKKVIKKALIIV